MSSSEDKDKQRKFEVKALKFQRFQIWDAKVIWEMSTFEMLSSEGARSNNETLRCNFQSFKVSRFEIWGDKVTWEISTFEMLAFERSSVEG